MKFGFTKHRSWLSHAALPAVLFLAITSTAITTPVDATPITSANIDTAVEDAAENPPLDQESAALPTEVTDDNLQHVKLIITNNMISAGFATIERKNGESEFYGHDQALIDGTEVPDSSVYSAPATENQGDLITINFAGLSIQSGQTISFSYRSSATSQNDTWLSSEANAFKYLAAPAEPAIANTNEREAQSFLQGNFELSMSVSPTLVQVGQPVTYTYTFKNTSSEYRLFWDKYADGAKAVIEDRLNLNDDVKCKWDEGNGWLKSSLGFRYINPNSEATFSCVRTFDHVGTYTNSVNIKEALQRKGPANGQKGLKLVPTTIDDALSVKVVNVVNSQTDPQWSLAINSSKFYVDPSGEDVTYTYTVTNLSNDKIYYEALKHDVCSPIKIENSLQFDPENRKYYIPQNGTATWECATRINHETAGLVSGTFSDNKGNRSTVKASTQTKVKTPTLSNGTSYGIPRCDVIDFTTVNKSTGIGTLGSIEQQNGQFKKIEQSNIFPEKGSPAHHDRRIKKKGRMTTASATSAQHPEYVYYAALALGDSISISSDANMGIYRIHKISGTVEKITAPHFSQSALQNNQRFGATLTNRLAFDATGKLWSFAQDGHLYSLPMDGDGKAAGEWFDHGAVAGEAINGEGNAVGFESLVFGDIAFDGNGAMWILGSIRGLTKEDTNGRVIKDEVDPTTYLFTLKPPRDNTPITEKVQIVQKITGVGTSIDQKGFFGLAFGVDGTLYGSYDTSGDGISDSPGELYSFNLRDGKVTKVFSSPLMARVQDLSSCAFPAPRISAEKTAAHEVDKDTITYTITVRNSGNLEATGTKFTDNLPGSYVPNSAKLNGKPIPDLPVNSTNPTGNPFHDGLYIKSPDAAPGTIDPQSEAVIEMTINKLNSTNDGRVCNQAEINAVGQQVKTDDPTLPGHEDPTCVSVPISLKMSLKKAIYDPSAQSPKILDNLGGAKFAIYARTETGDLGELRKEVSDEEPFEISPGTYLLVETQSPAGLSLLPKPVEFTITKSSSGFDVKSNSPLTVSFTKTDGIIVATVSDVKNGTLPKTGSTGFLPFVFVGLSIIVLTALWVQRRSQYKL
ncbi:LPXTG cell wall anchor domain-containing protein [Corynebacterium diphtheriae bv. gravis]|uniref:SpaA isopeptide-forming pilin-related protein n=1 Tax=Corynebacterium diphtheriae TaxID=1717 RepID=UPI0013C5B56C|nr:SpaA isopeptide-forming pilin-related protein [Corynebacterium diphtheriae]MBG9297161.1 LPXTG cell wall anchor domain-containing protein [Corynebacterium diphtheriae bv. gravis]CAB0570751.1 surface-anchored fimbrial associated protein [Corynebacterium diphtheriae]